MTPRDFRSPQYVAWRKKVYARDRWSCRMPGCANGRRGGLNAHHVRKWATHPGLRFDVGNGITLCRPCHEKVRGREEEFEAVFLRLARPEGGADAALRALAAKYGREVPGPPGHA